MKKKKGWLACVLLLLGTLFALSRKKDKRQKEAVYKFTFHLADKDTGEQIHQAEKASQIITNHLQNAGCACAEYSSYEFCEKKQLDHRDMLMFAVILLPDQKARLLLDAIKTELNLAHAWYIKEEHTYQELKKELR